MKKKSSIENRGLPSTDHVGERGGIWIAAIALALVVVSAPATILAQDGGAKKLKVDQAHSNVIVRAKHLGAGFTFFEFTDFSGTINYDAENPSKSSVELTVKAASLETGVEKRNNHLKSPDFFHVKKYPEIKFESTKVEKKDEKTLAVTGDLTIRDVTKSITVDIKRLGKGKDQKGNMHYGFYTEFELDRTEFDVDWKPDAGIVGKNIRLIIALEGVAK